MSAIATIEQLEAIYGTPNARLHRQGHRPGHGALSVLIEKSPFAALATCGRRDWIARRAAICPASSAFTTKRR